MAIVPCKLCGGQVDLPEKMTSGACPCCGCPTTFPAVLDDRTEKLYARAEQFRRTKDFDKAVAVYESILDFCPEDPDAYWGLLLSRSGIVYEEDPAAHERAPVCLREVSVSILADPDYMNAQKYADLKAREVYAKEALRIAVVQKVIPPAETNAAPDPAPAEAPASATAPAPAPTSAPAPASAPASTSAPAPEIPDDLPKLIRRVSILLEQREWDAAQDFCRKGIDLDPENPELYLMLCMAARQIPNENALRESCSNLTSDRNFQVALKLVSPDRRSRLEEIQQDALVNFHLKKCAEANGIQDVSLLSHCSVSLAEDESFRTVLKNAPPERMNELLQIQYDQAEFFLRQLKDRYAVRDLAEAPVPLGEDPAFQLALKSASPELRDELLEIRRSQCGIAFQRCLEANQASDEAALAQCAAPLADDPNFTLALQCAEPERREQLLQIQYAQSDFFLHRCMKKYHVSEAFRLRRCIVDMTTDPDFSAAMKCASPEQMEPLQMILAHQRKRKVRRCVTLLILLACILAFVGTVTSVYMIYPEVGAVFGVIEKQYELAEKHLMGKHDKRIDYILAAKWFRKAADRKHAAAQFQLGKLYLAGLGVEKNPAEAEKCFQRAAFGLRRSAQKGNAREQFLLGECCMNGWGLEKDEKKAVEWYTKAANAKYTPAQCTLGDCYLNGRGVEKDEKKAVEWYRKAERKDSSAMIALGECCMNGRGVKKDEKRGLMYYRMAARKGDVRAKYALGRFYEVGIGVEQDKAEAVEWYCKAAEQGLFDAQITLGRCYEHGVGMEAENTENAVKWYSRAAMSGSEVGQYELARCCENGIGVEENAEEAVKWYRAAAEHGFPEAQYELARCCENGIGMEKNDEEAVKWYRKAAEQSNLSAIKALERLGLPVKEDAGFPTETISGQSA